jgi:hypothetical protein
MGHSRGSVKPEGAGTFDEWLLGATSAHLACRDARHSWEPLTVDHDRSANVYSIVERCERGCGTCRTRWLNGSTGDLLTGAAYTYEPGFIAKGAGPFDAEHRAAARLERVRRLHRARLQRAA